ncbi:S8 family serine peptidase [Myxococcaceae bacterium GXIMD 01537]
MIAPDRPWAPDRSRMVMRGRVVLRVRAGEAPDEVPAHQDVARGQATATPRLDGGGIDRVLRRHSPAMRVSRVYPAARSVTRFGSRRHLWDDVEVATGMSRTFRVDLDPDTSLLAVVESLAELGIVEMACPHYLSVTPFAQEVEVLGQDAFYGHRMVGAESALRHEPGDTALIVGIVDSGVEYTHPELEGRMRPGVDTVDLAQELMSRGLKLFGDTSRRDRDPVDEMGHGSACAGIIGARGQRLRPGVGGAARLLPVRVLAGARMVQKEAPTAIGAVPDIDAGVKAAVDLGARVLNLSFGTPESALRAEDPRPHEDVVAYAKARGCVLVAASGNSGDSVRYFPAALPDVIAVGAVGPTGAPASFTSRGPHVALSAPGESIPSVGLGGTLRAHTGTSFAAPFVTGACALLLARAARMSEGLDPRTLRELLVRSVRPFAPGVDASGCGAGILDIPAALRALEDVLIEAEGEAAVAPTPAALNTHFGASR